MAVGPSVMKSTPTPPRQGEESDEPSMSTLRSRSRGLSWAMPSGASQAAWEAGASDSLLPGAAWRSRRLPGLLEHELAVVARQRRFGTARVVHGRELAAVCARAIAVSHILRTAVLIMQSRVRIAACSGAPGIRGRAAHSVGVMPDGTEAVIVGPARCASAAPTQRGASDEQVVRGARSTAIARIGPPGLSP
jgi:hypothetical protein